MTSLGDAVFGPLFAMCSAGAAPTTVRFVLVQSAETGQSLGGPIVATLSRLVVPDGNDASRCTVTLMLPAPPWPASVAIVQVSMLPLTESGAGVALTKDRWPGSASVMTTF